MSHLYSLYRNVRGRSEDKLISKCHAVALQVFETTTQYITFSTVSFGIEAYALCMQHKSTCIQFVVTKQASQVQCI